MDYIQIELSSGLPVLLAPMPQTPRMALAVGIRGGVSREPRAGMAKLASRLLVKGTERRSADELAHELDERAIDVRELVLADSMVLAASFLNREFDAALDLVEDMLFHSTFTDFDKEREKLDGETRAALDHPQEIAHDLLNATLFGAHPYGHTGTRMLDAFPDLTADGVRDWYYNGISPEQMNLVLVGDFDPDAVARRLEASLAGLVSRAPMWTPPPVATPPDECLVTRARPNAQQAQVLRGWLAPELGSPMQAPLTVMNTILGAGGLSSRLFHELRDKQGLAYSVRSQYSVMRLTGEFVVSIGTSPENIDRARRGFDEQIARMRNEPITDDELAFARGRLQGAYVLGHETTSHYCLDMAISQINGMPPDYSRRLLERVETVSIEDVQAAAQAIASPSITAVVAREEVLPAS